MRKFLLSSISFWFSCFIPFSALAIQDIVAINVVPNNSQVQFCFDLDTRKLYLNNLYIAAITEEGSIFTVKPTSDSFTLHDLSTTPAAIFSEWHKDSEPICLGYFEKMSLQNIDLYAGVGLSLDDVIQKQNYIRFFDGFPSLSQVEKKWTIMVYMVGSDLEQRGKWASKDFMEMLEGSNQAQSNSTHLIVSTGGSTRNGWQTVKRTYIQNGQQYVIEDLGAKNMADPQILSDFVMWAKANFPAEHYALILWNHGDGANGYGLDTSEAGNNDIMSLPELHQAYQTIRQLSEKPLDVVVYDACLMASIEVAEVTATVAGSMAGSAELEPGHGIDYAHLLSNIGTTPPDNGLDFGRVVKNGYIQHAKTRGSFERKQITYSVFDLAQIGQLSTIFKDFAIEFKNVLELPSFLNYERLTHGIIRAPGYPSKQTGRLRSLDNSNIHIDLYSILKTIGPDFPEFKAYADELLNIIDTMVVDYEGNIANIDPSAGRISIDIGDDKSYLAALSEAYTLLSDGLDFYNQRRKSDDFVPTGELTCPSGIVCAFAQWLELQAEEILGIEMYFGQSNSSDISDIYLIDKNFYKYKELMKDLELGVDGNKACQYQVCVNESTCENVTLTEHENQLLADVFLNDSPAILSFCQENDESWLACGVAQQTVGIWGRDTALVFEDVIVPQTVHIQSDEIMQQQGNALVVDESETVFLKEICEADKGAISAVYFSLNEKRAVERLCDSGDCVCQATDTDLGCQDLGFKAGIRLINY